MIKQAKHGSMVLVVSADAEFLEQVRSELASRKSEMEIAAASNLRETRERIQHGVPSVILLDESVLQERTQTIGARQPTLWATANSLAEIAPLVVVGAANQQMPLTSLLASGRADFVVRATACAGVAVGLVERRLRQRGNGLPAGLVLPRQREAILDDASEDSEPRDFGQVLRHELNNPLTGILGNAELLLVELRRKEIELPRSVELRLETIALLAVRMRETVRLLSEKWEAGEERESAMRELAERPQ